MVSPHPGGPVILDNLPALKPTPGCRNASTEEFWALLTPFNAIAARTGKVPSQGRRLPGEDEEDEEEDEEGCNAFHTHPRLPPPLRNPTLPGEQLLLLQHHSAEHQERNTEGLEHKRWCPPAPETQSGGGSGTEMLHSRTQCDTAVSRLRQGHASLPHHDEHEAQGACI